MDRRPESTVVDDALAQRVDRLGARFLRVVLEAARQDIPPTGVDFFFRGGVVAVACRARPDDPRLNRALELAPEDVEHVPALVTWYRRQAIWPWFEVSPGAGATALLDALAAEGAWPVGFNHVAVGTLARASGSPNGEPVAGLTVEPVDGDTIGVFAATLLDSHRGDATAGEADAAALDHWHRVPGLFPVLARVDGEPAGAAVLVANDGMGLLADSGTLLAQRGRGIGGALLTERLRLAADVGCEVVAGVCRFGSATHVAFQRAGLVGGYTRTVLHLGG